MKKRKIIAGVCTVTVLLTAAITGGSIFLIDYALRPELSQMDVREKIGKICRDYPFITSWADSLQTNRVLRDTVINAPDGTALHAYYVYASCPTRRTALLIHGYRNCAIDMLPIGFMYNSSLNCNILLPDLRHAGLSEGDAIQMGWLDRLDIMQWIDIAPSLFGDSLRMVIHGISMGGATTMMVSGEKLPGYVNCFVDDCGYTSVWDEFKKELHAQFGLPAFPLLYTASWLCNLKYGWNFHEASSMKQVSRCDKPMMFIHGADDSYVPTWMVYPLYEAKPHPKDLWIVPDTEHAVAYRNYPEEYTRRVGIFLGKYLK